jgi:hypothetical protein
MGSFPGIKRPEREVGQKLYWLRSYRMSTDILHFSARFHGVEREYLNGRGSGCLTDSRPISRTRGLYKLILKWISKKWNGEEWIGLLWIRKKLHFLPYGRSIGSWICLTHKTYTCHTVQNISDTHNIVLHISQRYNLQRPSFVSYQGCVVQRWVFGVPWYTNLLEWK